MKCESARSKSEEKLAGVTFNAQRGINNREGPFFFWFRHFLQQQLPERVTGVVWITKPSKAKCTRFRTKKPSQRVPWSNEDSIMKEAQRLWFLCPYWKAGLGPVTLWASGQAECLAAVGAEKRLSSSGKMRIFWFSNRRELKQGRPLNLERETHPYRC